MCNSSEPADQDVQVARIESTTLSLTADVAGPRNGSPVILSHGGGQTRHAWSRAVRALAKTGYRVVSVDLRGHGDSDWAEDGDYSLDALVDDLRSVIATLPVAPVLVGASLGGVASLLTIGEALRAGGPSPARALVLVDVAPYIEPVGAEHVRAFMAEHLDGFASVDEVADAVERFNPNRLRPKDPAGLLRNLRHGDDGRLYWHWDPDFLRRQDAGSLEAMNARLADAASYIDVPVLLVRGQLSDIVSEASVSDMLQRIPHAQVADITGAGHMVVGDSNDAFNQALFDFLRSL
jgi:pimeloyl-ACP methyl ester carboxylesterase